jgi:hypothetical protein
MPQTFAMDGESIHVNSWLFIHFLLKGRNDNDEMRNRGRTRVKFSLMKPEIWIFFGTHMLGNTKKKTIFAIFSQKYVQISLTQAFILFRCLTQLENFRGRVVVVVVQ